MARQAHSSPVPTSFMDVLRKWGCTWLWEHMSLEGGTDWISAAIKDSSPVAVTDGAYIRQLYLLLCLAAFVLKCSKGRRKLIGSFSEDTLAANAYRCKLLGLMAVHLLLVSVNKIDKLLEGSVEVVLDCLGALSRVVHLPPYWIPSRCKHSDILKNILVNCHDLTFLAHYSHVKAHQDNTIPFNKFTRICDHLAKQRIGKSAQLKCQPNSLFPLKPIGIFITGTIFSSNLGQQLQSHIHRQLAKALFLRKKILSENGFDEVGWPEVHSTLHSVPRLFQVWASKHMLRIAGTMKFLSHQDGRDTKCSSCFTYDKVCQHIAVCPEVGCSAAYQQSMASIISWMSANAAHSDVKSVVAAYALGRDNVSCLDCADGYPAVIRNFAALQDKIGWGNFMMGMVSSKLFSIQESHLRLCAPYWSPDKWAMGFITQLLQVMCAQWIYQCLLVHDHT
jgi:hypothetical protein